MSDTVDIGAARVRLIVDAADFQPAIEQGKNAVTGFGQSAQQAYDRTEKGTRRAADALLDYVNSLGRADTTMDRYIRNASRMGVEKPVLDAAIAAWQKHNAEVEQASSAQSSFSHANAGVNRELLVLAHELSQGNFSRFGGSMLVLAERTNALKFAMSGAGLATLGVVGVLVGVAAAFESATSRSEDFAIATAKGNLVAGNAKGLSNLAEQLSKLNNISIGNADAAVQSLAAAGKLTGDNFAIAAQAAARWATITGTSADEIIGKFNELATDPMAAVLNGTLKITEAQYEQLEAFERTGQKVKEAQLAVKLYADQINTDSQSVLDNLSAGARGWIELKEAITGAWHAFSQFTSEAAGAAFNKLRAPSLHDFATAGLGGDQAIAIGGEEEPLFQPPAETTRSGFGGVGTDQGAGSGLAQTTKLTTDQVNANKELQKSIDELGTKQQRYAAAITLENGLLARSSEGFLKLNGVIKNLDGSFSGPGYDKLVNGIRLKIFGQNEGGDPTLPIKEWQKTALDALKNVGLANDELYKNHLVSIDTFYDISEGLTRADAVIQLQAIDKEIEALKGRDNAASKIAALRQERNTVEQMQSNDLLKLENQRADALKVQRIEYENYVDALGKANIALARQGDQAARGLGLGDRQSALANAQDNAKFATATNIQDIQRQIDSGQKDPAEGLKEQEAAAAALSTQLDILKGNYDSLTTAQSSWQNGATKAWQNFNDQVSNVAAQTQAAVTSVLNDLTDMFVTLAQTGHLSVTKLLTDITTQIEKSGIQYALQQAFKSLGSIGNQGGSSSGDFGTNFGSLATSIGSLLFSAKGNVFPAGTGLAAHVNSVVSSPTVFPFAKGGVPNIGVMGEAGSEGIFPLTRTSSGELGVKAVGNNQPTRVTNVNQTIVVPGAATRATQDQTAIKVYGAAQRAARRS